MKAIVEFGGIDVYLYATKEERYRQLSFFNQTLEAISNSIDEMELEANMSKLFASKLSSYLNNDAQPSFKYGYTDFGMEVYQYDNPNPVISVNFKE